MHQHKSIYCALTLEHTWNIDFNNSPILSTSNANVTATHCTTIVTSKTPIMPYIQQSGTLYYTQLTTRLTKHYHCCESETLTTLSTAELRRVLTSTPHGSFISSIFKAS